MLIFDTNNPMPLDATEKSKFRQFFVTSFEQVWMERNTIWKEGKKKEWKEISANINRSYSRY